MENTKIIPTEYDMLIGDEQALLDEMEENKAALISLEVELQIVRNKLAFIKRAVSENAQISSYN